jgi:molecular chaperone Hsp33
VLLAATLKFHGTLTLQFEGNGLVRLLIAQCTHDFGVRAVARFDEAALQSATARPADGWTFRSLVGDAGRVIVTIEATERDLRYQGVVPLTGDSLSDSLEAYFGSSEQLPTRVRLAANENETVGLLIQKLPGTRASGDDPDTLASAWDQAQSGVAGVSGQALLGGSIEEVLTMSLGGQDLRLFTGTPVRSECRCNPERVSQLLRALGQAEVADVIREQGSVTVTCEFCQRPYRFSASDADALFSSDAVPPGSGALH